MGTLFDTGRQLSPARLNLQQDKTGSPELLFPDLYFAPFDSFTNSHSAGNVITQVTSVPTFLHGIHIRMRGGSAAGAAFTIYDNVTTSAVRKFTIRAGVNIELISHPLLDIAFVAGMRVDITLPLASEIDYTLTFKTLR